MIVWSVANQKGGVGKTTTTIALAGLLVQQKKRVLIIDTDPHGSLTTYIGFEPDDLNNSLFGLFQLTTFDENSIAPFVLNTKFGIDIIPSHMSLATLDRVMGNRSGMGLILKRVLTVLKDQYDYVLIDCPPILGVMMVNALAASHRILIPVQTDFLALKGLERIMKTLAIMERNKKSRFDITIIPTMYDKRTNASLQALRELQKSYSEKVWLSVIPIDTKFRDASYKGEPPSINSPDSRGVFAYKMLLKYLENLTNA